MRAQHSMVPLVPGLPTAVVRTAPPRPALVVVAQPAGRGRRVSMRSRLVRLLMFVYGPADIGPLGPPTSPHASKAAGGVLTPDARQRIRVIPVR